MENTPYEEALRYMANAKETLKNAKLNHRYNVLGIAEGGALTHQS